MGLTPNRSPEIIRVVAKDTKKKVVVIGAVAAIVLGLVIYLMGRRTGKRKSTVLEIRRL